MSATKAVLNLWAGVEKIVGNPTLTQPLRRMVDPAMTDSMVEWVVAHTLRHHLGMDAHILGQDGIWRGECRVPAAGQRTTGDGSWAGRVGAGGGAGADRPQLPRDGLEPDAARRAGPSLPVSGRMG